MVATWTEYTRARCNYLLYGVLLGLECEGKLCKVGVTLRNTCTLNALVLHCGLKVEASLPTTNLVRTQENVSITLLFGDCVFIQL